MIVTTGTVRRQRRRERTVGALSPVAVADGCVGGVRHGAMAGAIGVGAGASEDTVVTPSVVAATAVVVGAAVVGGGRASSAPPATAWSSPATRCVWTRSAPSVPDRRTRAMTTKTTTTTAAKASTNQTGKPRSVRCHQPGGRGPFLGRGAAAGRGGFSGSAPRCDRRRHRGRRSGEPSRDVSVDVARRWRRSSAVLGPHLGILRSCIPD